MGKCVKCEKMLHPMFMRQLMTHPNDPNAQQCIFCEQRKSEILKDDGTKYTKEAAIKDYEKLLKILSEKANIAELLTKGKMEI